MIAKMIASETIHYNPRFRSSLGNRLKWTFPDDPGKYWANRGFDPLTVHIVDCELQQADYSDRPIPDFGALLVEGFTQIC